MSPVIEMRDLRKRYGRTQALDGLNLTLPEGRILGLVGPNGAGKSTALSAMLGLTPCEGELRVLGRDPWRDRERLMQDVSFVSDVAVMPRWLRVSQALDYVSGVHPRFDRVKAEHFLAKTNIARDRKVRELSKGMTTQLNLALVMAIDARLLVLDEPTIGLDILVRNQFFDSLLNDYFDGVRTVIIATHQIDEVQNVLSDVAFIDHGRMVLESSMDEFAARYLEVLVHPQHVAAGRALKPLRERTSVGRTVMLFDGVPRDRLSPLGDVRTPGLGDLYIAVMTPQTGAAA
jgi:ABC-2 type transport system ATP-binding protein